MNTVTELTEETLEQFVAGGDTIVKFGAPWCGPCRAVKPTLESISSETDIKVGDVDIDDQPELAQKFNVKSVPTFIMYKGGKLIETLVGSQTKDTILAPFK